MISVGPNVTSNFTGSTIHESDPVAVLTILPVLLIRTNWAEQSRPMHPFPTTTNVPSSSGKVRSGFMFSVDSNTAARLGIATAEPVSMIMISKQTGIHEYASMLLGRLLISASF